MNCIIIEDQLPAQRILKKYISDIGTLNLAGTYSDALQAMDILNTQPVDLMFLDIHLPKISGIDFLKSLSNPPQVILTTAFSDYALESYELSVVDYLLKPFSFERFVKAVSKATEKNLSHETLRDSTLSQRSEIFIKSGYEHIRINLADVYFIKSDADYTEIHLYNKKHLSSDPLKNWEDRLENLPFSRIHKSYIVNTEKIKKIIGNQVYLNDDMILPIGRAFKEVLVKKFIN
ncbi:response regulator transcription factor [Reichenbachiella carrageenanivorans]|uniref:Response regulator transcription factor n=1 Tax=Reichenbachiella carrageenanivorans TaxID=2979869 RepID=A0ABY6D8C1_9BACT|nr:response regulator transcription factor [Reichenbachiella carrageenanivorans]UXX80120.1 response regulator transcription factor [Reichenbachiella carrageenanivorans]